MPTAASTAAKPPTGSTGEAGPPSSALVARCCAGHTAEDGGETDACYAAQDPARASGLGGLGRGAGWGKLLGPSTRACAGHGKGTGLQLRLELGNIVTGEGERGKEGRVVVGDLDG